MTSVFGDYGITRAQAAALLHPGYPAGGQQWCMRGTLNASNAFPGVDSLRLVPIFEIVNAITLIGLAFRVQTGGAGSSAKIALWRNNPATARPVGIPVLGGNTPLDTSASVTTRSVSGSFAAAPGVYWAGIVVTGGTMPNLLAEQSNSSFRGIVQTSSFDPLASHFSIAQPFANDIMALDLTGATLVPSSAAGAATIFRIEWA